MGYTSPQKVLQQLLVHLAEEGFFLFFSQTAAVGIVLQGKGIKTILKTLKMFLTRMCQAGFILSGTSYLYFRGGLGWCP